MIFSVARVAEFQIDKHMSYFYVNFTYSVVTWPKPYA